MGRVNMQHADGTFVVLPDDPGTIAMAEKYGFKKVESFVEKMSDELVVQGRVKLIDWDEFAVISREAWEKLLPTNFTGMLVDDMPAVKMVAYPTTGNRHERRAARKRK